MDTRICSTCKTAKSLSEFYLKKKSSNKYSSYCKSCWSLRHREYYSANKKYYKDKSKKQGDSVLQLVKELKNLPCMDCGKTYPHYVMDFDHRDGSLKEENISRLAADGCRRRVLVEVKKCDIVCSNCHRERTHGGRGRAVEAADCDSAQTSSTLVGYPICTGGPYD